MPPSASAGSPVRAPQFFRTGTGHQVKGRNPWQLQCTHKSAPCGTHFDVSLVRFRYGPPGCSPPGLTRPTELNVSTAYRGFYFRASSHRVTPITAGYNYGAKLRIAPAGLSPASTAASLAALPPVGAVAAPSPEPCGSPPSSVLWGRKTAPYPSQRPPVSLGQPVPLPSDACSLPPGRIRTPWAWFFWRGRTTPRSREEIGNSPRFLGNPFESVPRARAALYP